MSTLDQRTSQSAACAAGQGAVGAPILLPVPHYAQTLDFTCGPSALMMVMKALDPTVEMSRALEMQLWREATTIFMGAGHGGSGAFGLAIAAHRRGFDAEVTVNHKGVLLADRARSDVKREVMRLVQETDLREARERGIPVAYGRLGADDLERKAREGWLPIVLVSTFYIHGDHVPHWVVVTGLDAEAVTLNDPWVDVAGGKTAADMSNLRVPRKDFDGMARYGKARERAAVLVRRRPAP
ncbi:peptidase C39 family protein [Rhodospirillaceae bacterium SYSU D60014]|uniref:peptidase C39 family protein n=1 Tax=Virgifigura deserti TaxID=2268457 RepID=UPI000E6601DF